MCTSMFPRDQGLGTRYSQASRLFRRTKQSFSSNTGVVMCESLFKLIALRKVHGCRDMCNIIYSALVIHLS